jgi:NADPH2:quinone reductase
MRAIEITDIKKEDNLKLIETDAPKPAKGQVLIKVAYASVNRPDLLQRKGLHPIPKGASTFPGLDVSGSIVELGENCAAYNLNVGDEVCALLSGGGYAEYAVADAALCLPKPQSLSLQEAAALPECIFTVWNNLFIRGNLKKGETVLIHGGSSGIGNFAIQMAKAAGATVITTAGNEDKCKACLNIGADIAINYKTDDFEQFITEQLGPNSINVVLDMVGGDYLSKNINLLAAEGRHINIAFLNGKDACVDISKIMQKRLILTGSTLRTRPLEEKSAIARDIKTHVWPWIEEGKIKPHIHAEFPLADVLKAHEVMKKSQHIGKIILAI